MSYDIGTIDQIGTNFVWFFGVVENRNDPLKLGRLQVRIYNWHSSDLVETPTDSLPWAMPIQGINSAAMGDVGKSPTGIVEGTWVVGFFIDGHEAQQPIIMGTTSGIPLKKANTEKGFSDPNGVYPKRINEPDVNRLARNDNEYQHSVLTSKENKRTKSVETSTDSTWDEPASTYDATYPKNHVMETESGHIKEYDDTENKQRIHEYHNSGTFYEIDNDGNKVTRVVGDNYEIVAGTNYVNVKGAVNLTIDNNCNTYIKGDWNIQVDGQKIETVKGDVTENYNSDHDVNVTGNQTQDAKQINLNSGTKGAARIGDTADTGDDPPGISGSDGSNKIETGSKTVIIGG